MDKRRLLLLITSLFLLLLLGACGQAAAPSADGETSATDEPATGSEGESDDSDAGQSGSDSEDGTESGDDAAGTGEEEITLTFWRITGDSAEAEAEKRLWDDSGELYKQWREEHPNIDIAIESTPFDEYTTKQLTALRAGAGGDVMLVDNLAVAPAAGTGGLEPLDQCIDSQAAIDPSDWIPKLYDVGNVDGTQYTLPFDTDTRILFYNKQILEEAGVAEVPATWDAYYDAAEKIAALDGDVHPMSYSGARFWALSYMWMGPWFNQLDASLLTEDGSASAVMEPATQEAFEHGFKLAQYSPSAAISYVPPDLHTLFTQGKLAFLIQGPWLNNVIQENTDWEVGNQYGVALIPGPEEGVTGSANGGWHIGIGANSAHKEAACEFLAWLTSPEIMAQATKDHIPTRLSAQESDFYQEYVADDPVMQKAIEQSATGGPPIAAVPEAPEIAQVLHRHFLRAVEGEATLEEALAQLDEEINNLLQKR